jgi:four helix bundle protein
MESHDLKIRTRDFAVRIVKLFSSLPKNTEAQILGKQLLRSGTSVGAQFREAQHAKSDADFISKLEGSLQELEETAYWLELIEDLGFFTPVKLMPIRQETKELTAIFVTIVKKVKTKEECRLISPLSLILYNLAYGFRPRTTFEL